MLSLSEDTPLIMELVEDAVQFVALSQKLCMHGLINESYRRQVSLAAVGAVAKAKELHYDALVAKQQASLQAQALIDSAPRTK